MKRVWAVLGILASLVVSLPADAAMRGLSAEELATGADLVVDGTVEQVASYWSQDGRAIVSRATVVVGETVRGNSNKRSLIVEYPGGEIGEVGMKVSDMEPLRTGEGVLLFLKVLRRSSGGEVHQLVGRAQGKYVIGKDRIARKGGFSLVSGDAVVDNDIDVDELKRKVRNVR